MSVQVSSIISTQIYRADDAPLCKSTSLSTTPSNIRLYCFISPDRRGNRVLIGLCAMNLVLFPLVKLYYIMRNKYKRRQWEALSPEVSCFVLRSSRIALIRLPAFCYGFRSKQLISIQRRSVGASVSISNLHTKPSNFSTVTVFHHQLSG